jgi:hypothetical protein
MSINIFEQRDFSGGINLRSDQFQLADNESPQMMNLEIDPRGGLFSRGAMRRINPNDGYLRHAQGSTVYTFGSAWKPKKVMPFYGTTPTIIFTTETNIFRSTGGNLTQIEVSDGVPVASTTTHGPCPVGWNKTLYIATGGTATSGNYFWNTTDNYATVITRAGQGGQPWQATAAAAGTVQPQAEHLVVHANKMFAASVSEPPAVNASTPIDYYPNRLRWSLEGIPTKWNFDHYIDIIGGGEGIRSIVSVQGQLLIFKPRAIYALVGYDTDTFNVVEISTTVGCEDHNYMAVSETGVYFWSNEHGFFYYDGSQLRDLTAPIRSLIDLNQVNTGSEESISVGYIRKRVWISLPYSKTTSVSTPTVNFVFDPQLNCFIQFSTADNAGLMSGCDFMNSSGDPIYLAIHPTINAIMSVDIFGNAMDNITGTEEGYVSYYRTKWFDAGTYMQRKMFRRPDFVVKESTDEQTIIVGVYHDFDETSERRRFNLLQPEIFGFAWDEDFWNQASPAFDYGSYWAANPESSRIVKGRNLGLCKAVQLLFEGPIGDEWGINSIGYKFTSKRVTG